MVATRVLAPLVDRFELLYTLEGDYAVGAQEPERPQDGLRAPLLNKPRDHSEEVREWPVVLARGSRILAMQAPNPAREVFRPKNISQRRVN